MLALRIGRLHDQVDEAARNRDLSWRDGAARDELFGLADDDAVRVMRRLGDRQRVEGDGFVLQGTITLIVDGAGAKNANVQLEAAIEHEVLAVNRLDRDVVRRMFAGRLVDFAGFDPGIDEGSQADPRQVSGSAGGDGSI